MILTEFTAQCGWKRICVHITNWLSCLHPHLHLDGVALLQGAVQDAGGVDDLPPQVPVVHVAHKQRLGGERVRLHLHIGARHLHELQAAGLLPG